MVVGTLLALCLPDWSTAGSTPVSYTHLDVYKRQDYKEFIESETRYSRLQRAFPERAQVLFDKAADAAKDRYEYLGKLAKLYE